MRFDENLEPIFWTVLFDLREVLAKFNGEFLADNEAENTNTNYKKQVEFINSVNILLSNYN